MYVLYGVFNADMTYIAGLTFLMIKMVKFSHVPMKLSGPYTYVNHELNTKVLVSYRRDLFIKAIQNLLSALRSSTSTFTSIYINSVSVYEMFCGVNRRRRTN